MKAVKLKDLHPNDWNPNTMTDDEFDELVAEIEHLGKPAKPIVVRPNGKGYEIVDGEHTYRALLELGYTEIQPEWYEVDELDDFEAMRQTYKRNQHGTHNPVKQGQLFKHMMDERELSQRALADEIDVSEGTIRNSLEYAKAAEVRNDYAFDELTVKQIRAYNRLPRAVGDLWLDCGANLRVLYIRPERMRETKLQSFDEAMNSDEYYDWRWVEDYTHESIEGLGPLMDLIPMLCHSKTPEGFRAAVRRALAMDGQRFSFRYARGHVDRETVLPYFRSLAKIRWKDTNPKVYGRVAREVLEEIFRVDHGKCVPVVPVDAFENWVVVENARWDSSDELAAGLHVLVGKFRPELRKQDVQRELMALELEDAPDYIKELPEIDVSSRYALWQASNQYIQRGASPELLIEVITDAADAVVQNKRNREEVDELRNTNPELHIQALAGGAGWRLSPAEALSRAYNETLKKKQRVIFDELFNDKLQMIAFIVEKAKRLYVIREGSINQKKAADVLAARLAMLDTPELKMLCHYVVEPSDYYDPFTLWFNELGGTSVSPAERMMTGSADVRD